MQHYYRTVMQSTYGCLWKEFDGGNGKCSGGVVFECRREICGSAALSDSVWCHKSELITVRWGIFVQKFSQFSFLIFKEKF